MLRRLIRVVATLLVFLVIGVVVAAVTGGVFMMSGGVATCPAPADGGSGPAPAAIQGGYEVWFRVQAGDFVVRPAATLMVRPDTVTMTGDRCRTGR